MKRSKSGSELQGDNLIDFCKGVSSLENSLFKVEMIVLM